MTIRYVCGLFGVLTAVSVATAQDEPPPSELLPKIVSAAAAVGRGAKASNVVPSTFRAQLVVDNRFKEGDARNRAGKMHCLVCEYGLSPVVAVFVRADLKGDTAGLVNLLKGVDTLTPKYRADKLAAFAMFLKLDGGTKVVTVKRADGTEAKVVTDLEYPDDEDRATKAEEVKALAGKVGTINVPFGLAPTKSAAITAFAISDVPVTVVIYNRMRIVQRWELKLNELTPAKIEEILAATAEMASGNKKK